MATGTGGRCLQEAAEARTSWPPSARPHRCRDREPPGSGQQRPPGKTLPWVLHPRAGEEGRLCPLLTPPTSSSATAHPSPEAFRHQGAALGLGWPGPDTWRPTHDHGPGHGERHMSHVPRAGTWCHGPAAPGPCIHQAWCSTVLGTGLGSAVVQLLLESPSRAGHAEKHLPVLQGLKATSCSPSALFGISLGLDWKKPFQKLHLLLGQKQVTADSAATEAG